MEAVCSGERLKYTWAKALENSHTSPHLNRSWAHTDPASRKGETGRFGAEHTAPMLVGVVSCCARPPQSSAPSAPAVVSCLPTLSLLIPHLSIRCLWAAQPHASPHAPLSERINIWKKLCLISLPQAALCASSAITWKTRFSKISLLWEKRAHCDKEGNWGLPGAPHHVPSTRETEFTIQSSTCSREQMSPQPPLLKT